MAGFSPQNIWKMRGFFLAWTAEVRNLSQAVRESRRDKFLSQLAREIDGEHLPRVAAEIPWGHNMVLIFKLKDPVQRLWYGHQATANGWSRSMLEHWIESDVYSRQGEAVTNFSYARLGTQLVLLVLVVSRLVVMAETFCIGRLRRAQRLDQGYGQRFDDGSASTLVNVDIG